VSLHSYSCDPRNPWLRSRVIRKRRLRELGGRPDRRGVDLISDVLPFGKLWYGGPDAIGNAIGHAKFYSRSHDAVIRVYDAAGNVIVLLG